MAAIALAIVSASIQKENFVSMILEKKAKFGLVLEECHYSCIKDIRLCAFLFLFNHFVINFFHINFLL